MKDFLLGDDHFISLCMATLGFEEAEVRLGERMYKQQAKYSKLFDNKGPVYKGLRSLADKGRRHMCYEKNQSESAGDIVREKVPNELQGNFQVYSLADFMLETRDRYKLRGTSYNDEKEIWEKCYQSTIVRSGTIGSLREQSEELRDFESYSEILAKMTTLEIAIENLNFKRVEEHNRYLKKDEFKYNKRSKSEAQEHFDMIVVGAIKVFVTDERCYYLTENHYKRFIDYMKSLRNASLLGLDIKTKCSISDVSMIMHRICMIVAKEDSNAVGEAMKAARQISFLNLERSEILGKSSTLYQDTLEQKRRERADKIISSISTISGSAVVKTNILGFYTSLPHPDAPLDMMFRSIEGVREPNKTDKNFERRFDGVLRRTLFMSMRKSGHDVRTTSTGPESEDLSDKTNDVTQSMAAAVKYSTTAWSKTKFQEVRTIPKLSEIEVPVASKASSAGIIMTVNEEQEAKAYYSGYGDSITSKLFKPTSVNDAAESIRGRSRMNIDKCTRRFSKIVSLHERFESRYRDKEIEDIPSKDLEKFIKAHPMAQYVVGTEGKFGEVHKVVTRLFYMAEQELKALTQRVERIGRQVSRSQMGVSIVKSYMGRRSDLDRCVRSMTGKSADMRSIAVSFDMSEFSKKFPMSLVRRYGTILSEITGETDLKRIDLFFRAAKVMYSNRGYYNDLRGARGGFEGFLNFIWSSIHAAIMEVALETTGVKGDLLTFSDDGLLIFYPRSTVPDYSICKLIEKIRDAYMKLGLVFHLGKTLVSDHMWEYLGDVCYDNRLIPMWFKEMVKIGRINPTRGFTPLFDKIQVVDAQASAMVVSSGNPITSYLIKRYTCDRILRGWVPESEFLLREVMLILPPSCGGLRITSPYEDTNVTNLSNDMEIYSDIVLLEKYKKGMYAKVTSAILSKMEVFKETRKNYRRAISNLSFFKTSIPDTSGDAALSKLLEHVRLRTGYRMPEDPLTLDAAEEVYMLLSTAENLDLDSIQSLLNAIPGMSEYRTHRGVMKGSGALKLASRKALRKAQSANTKNVKASISFWTNIISGDPHIARNDFLSECLRRNYPSFHICPPRPPPRLILQKIDSRKDACIEVLVKSFNEVNVYDHSYKEPVVKTSLDRTTMMWNSELKGSNEIRDMRKMLAAIQAILSHSPQCENLVRGIAEIFGVLPPATLSGRIRGSHRDRKGVRRAVESRLILPRYHMSKMEYRFLGKLTFFLANEPRKDENTYGVCAQSLAYFIHARQYHLGYAQPPSDCRYYFKIDNNYFRKCFTPTEMNDSKETPKIPNDSNLSKRLDREYLSYAAEQEKQVSQSEFLFLEEEVRDGLSDEKSTLLVNGMIKVVENYLVSMKSMSTGNILVGHDIPELAYLRTYVLRRAIVSAALKLYDPPLRQRLSISISNRRESGNLDELIDEPLFLNLLNNMSEMYNLLPAEVKIRTPEIGLDDFNNSSRLYLNIISANLFDSSILSSKKMVIFFSKNFLTHEVSNDHRVAYRMMLRETIISIHSAFKERNWSDEALKRDFPVLMNSNIDETIDCLRVFYPLIRSSKHRSNPYNSRSALIMLKKFYTLVFRMYAEVQRLRGNIGPPVNKKYYVTNFLNWVPNSQDRSMILNIVKDPGEDMIRNVDRKFDRATVTRAAYYAYKYQVRRSAIYHIIGRKGPKNEEIYNIQTAFKEMIMSAALKKINAYGYGMANMVRSEFINISPDVGTIAGVQTNCDMVTGIDVMQDRLTADVGELIINHAEIVRQKSGLLGFQSDGHEWSDLSNLIKSHYALEGVPSTPVLSTIKNKYNYTAVDYECSNIGKAITTYMHLQKGDNSSLSIVKFPVNIPPDDLEVEDDISEAVSIISEESNSYASCSEHRMLSQGIERVPEEEVWYFEGEEDVGNGVSLLALMARGMRWADICEMTDDDDAEKEYVTDEEEDIENNEFTGGQSMRQMEDENFNFRVIGVTSNNNIKENSRVNPAVASNMTDTILELIDNVSIRDSIYETSTIISSLSTNPLRSVSTSNAPYSISRQNDLFTPGVQINERSILLQNAVEMASDHNDGKTLIGSYIMLHCWLSGANTKNKMINCANEVLENLRNENTRTSLLLDVSMMMRWLRSSDIKPGLGMSHSKKSKVRYVLMKLLPDFNITIDVHPTTMMFRSFESLRSLSLASRVNNLKKYKDIAYYLPYHDFEEVHLIEGDESDDETLFE